MHENEFNTARKVDPACTCEEYSEIGDNFQYKGTTPSGRHLQHVYRTHHKIIRHHLDNEVTNPGATSLCWDVSHNKEANNLCNFKGQSIYHGLVSAMNEFNEIQIQFHVYADSHDQKKAALHAFNTTQRMYVMADVRLFFTDNPKLDRCFFSLQISSLSDSQQELDTNTLPLEICSLQEPSSDLKSVVAKSCGRHMNSLVCVMRRTIKEQKIVGFDLEWKPSYDQGVASTDKVAVMHMCHINEKGGHNG